MKQILLRVPDEMKRRFAARARREGRSVNAVATEMLDACAEADIGDRRTRLAVEATGAGICGRPVERAGPKEVAPAKRKRIIDSTRGLGRGLDRLLTEERDRR